MNFTIQLSIWPGLLSILSVLSLLAAVIFIVFAFGIRRKWIIITAAITLLAGVGLGMGSSALQNALLGTNIYKQISDEVEKRTDYTIDWSTQSNEYTKEALVAFNATIVNLTDKDGEDHTWEIFLTTNGTGEGQVEMRPYQDRPGFGRS